MTTQTQIAELAKKCEMALIYKQGIAQTNVFGLTVDQRIELAQKSAMANAEYMKCLAALNAEIAEYAK